MKNSMAIGILLSALPLMIGAKSDGCVEPKLHKGTTTDSPGTNSCHCGIIIRTDHLTCPNYQIVEPDVYECDGPKSDFTDCKLGTPLPVNKNTVKCKEKSAHIDAGIFGLEFGLTLPVCVGTECVTTNTEILSYKNNAIAVACPKSQQSQSDLHVLDW